MEEQLEFDWNEYEVKRNQAIVNNVEPVIGEKLLLTDLTEIKEEPQENYDAWLKRMLKNDRKT
jgi:hypothetical protein